MQFTLVDIVFVAVLVTQLAIALIALVSMRGLTKRFAKPLGSKVTLVELLQKYSRIFSALNIKVDARIKLPALAKRDTLLVNRRSVYATGLYTNFYTLYQIVLLQPAYRFLPRIRRWQLIMYVLQILIYTVGIYAYDPLKIVAAFLGVALLVTSFVYQSYLTDILMETYEIAADLLDLDEVEQARAKALVHEMRSDAFTYAFRPFIWLVRFVIPIGSTP